MIAKRSAGPDSPIDAYACERVLRLLRKLQTEVKRTAESADAEAIHDVRVATRRLREGLRVFGSLLPRANQMRRRLKKLTNLASQVRDRDIALELMKQARVPARSVLVRQLTAEREEAFEALQATLVKWREGRRLAEWSRDLRQGAS